MPDFGRSVGIQFTEAAFGHVAGQISDHAVAEELAKTEGAASAHERARPLQQLRVRDGSAHEQERMGVLQVHAQQYR